MSDTSESTPKNHETCGTCYGEGATPSEHGLLTCVDCGGVGRLPSGLVRTEWRLRELERIHGAAGTETGQEVRWLVAEVRRAQHVLLQILAASDDTDTEDPALTRIKFLANDALGVYPTTRE